MGWGKQGGMEGRGRDEDGWVEAFWQAHYGGFGVESAVWKAFVVFDIACASYLYRGSLSLLVHRSRLWLRIGSSLPVG